MFSIRTIETRNDISEKVSELSDPGTHFDRQPHTYHMVRVQTALTNQIPKFLTGRLITTRDPLSHQHQNVSLQVSQDNI